MAVAMVGGVDRGLFRADVVRPDRLAGMPDLLRDQPAAGEKIDEGRRREDHRFNRTGLRDAVKGGKFRQSGASSLLKSRQFFSICPILPAFLYRIPSANEIYGIARF